MHGRGTNWCGQSVCKATLPVNAYFLERRLGEIEGGRDGREEFWGIERDGNGRKRDGGNPVGTGEMGREGGIEVGLGRR